MPGTTTSSHAPERLELVARIGSGGVAEVHRARIRGARGFARLFAVKRLRPEIATDPRHVDRFAKEACLCALLDHPNIVQAIDFLELEGRPTLVMELVQGPDLLRLLEAATRANRRIPTELAIHITLGMLAALDYAHGMSPLVVHRDVSPANVMVSVHGEVKLIDFGIAANDGTRGEVRGKVGYMSPELVNGGAVGPSSDLFAAGTVLWEMLTLRRLFKSEDDAQTIRNIAEARIADRFARHDYVPESLRYVLAKALLKNPEDRWANAAAFAAALRHWLATSGLAYLDLASGLGKLVGELLPGDGDRARPHQEPPPVPTASLDLSHLEAVLAEIDSVPVLEGFERLVEGTWVDPLTLAARPDRDAELDFADFGIGGSSARAVSLGPLDPWTLPAVTVSLAARGFTGGLTLVDGWRQKTCVYEGGRLVQVTSNIDAELLGNQLAERGAVSEADARRGLALARERGIRLGDALVTLGALAPERLAATLAEQTAQRFTELFGWSAGRLVLVPGLEGSPALTSLPQHDVVPLVMRALRETWSRASVVALFERFADRVVRWCDARHFGPEDLGLLDAEREALVMLAREPRVHEVLLHPGRAHATTLLALVQTAQVRLSTL